MTDLATPPTTGDDSAATPSTPGALAAPTLAEPTLTEPEAPLAWAPAEAPSRRPWRRALFIGLPIAAVVAAAWYFGTTIIAPGMVVGNVAVGGLTVQAATEKINAAVADTSLLLSVDGTEAAVSGAELGAHVDAPALAAAALSSSPLWKIGSWYPANGPSLRPALDPVLASETLRDAFPETYTAAVDAGVNYDPASVSFVAVDGTDGWGVPRVEVRSALVAALNTEAPAERVEVAAAAFAPELPSSAAHNRVAVLNGMLDTIGFYVGTDRAVPIDRAAAASWITVVPDTEAGIFRFNVDASALPALVEALPEQVNRAPVDTQQVVNSAGDVLRVVAEGVSGRELVSTDGVADAFAQQLNAGAANYQLDVTETAFGTAALHRRIEVDISEQRTTLFENDVAVQSWRVSTGLPGHETDLGHYKIYAHVRIQDMGSEAAGYLTKDVPWVSYFNQDEAFHGAYWHNNFGRRMSHGCVNMRLSDAKFVYEWAPIGTEVWVHN